ncbi:helicase-associated domain-containing protein [Microbacterium luticocti]|uniref:helicase-associated domain-containing protein n=1 Tax=Microbacterium luticocti TaxID=451764 RepID=UPI00041DFB36|nr:helicase-associated domain-containing protein [Microbacterium luticocti]
MAALSDARELATLLAGLRAQRLAEVLHARGVSAQVGWRDCFDAAEGLLEPASIDAALRQLPRVALQGVDAAASSAADPGVRDRLEAAALLRADGTALGAVTDRVHAARAAHPEAFEAVATAEPAGGDAVAAAQAAERAADTVRAVTDLVARAADDPVNVTGTGAITAVDRRRLVDGHLVESPAELDDLVALAADARLLALVDRQWRQTTVGAAWLRGTIADRWAALATGWVAALPGPLRTDGGGYPPPTQWPHAAPLDETWQALAATLWRQAVRAGLYAADGTEPAWTAPLRTGATPDQAALTTLLPAEIDRIYLQADLTAIAPGPLRSPLDLRLQTMATRESRAQASTYRFTADTIAAAVAGGEDAASLRTFLAGLSLTGIPQPLDYLIAEATARHGSVQVATDAATGRTRVTSSDPQLLRTIAVDQSLHAIGLTEDGDALVSRVGRDAVFFTLADARYPVVARDAAGRAEPLRRRRDPVPVPADEAAAALLPVAERLLAHSADDADAAWLVRELEQAVRTRGEITVTVRMPDGTERDFTMEATGLGGGRLRGLDRAADIERTLPVSGIVRVRPR